MSAHDLFVGLLVALLIPSAWTGAVSAARALETRGGAAPFSDRAEKILLALMLAPSVLGALFLAWSMAPQPYAPLPSLLIDVAFLPENVSTGAARQIAAPAFDWLGASVWALALVYACGCLWRAARLGWAHVRLARIAMGAADASVRWGRGAAVTNARVSPFLAANGKVILPRSLIESWRRRRSNLSSPMSAAISGAAMWSITRLWRGSMCCSGSTRWCGGRPSAADSPRKSRATRPPPAPRQRCAEPMPKPWCWP